MSSRARNWCFTWNHYPEDWEIQLQGLQYMGYYKCGKEVAPTTGTPHLQGYAHFKQKMSIKMLKALPAVHWEPMRGSIEQSDEYCGKDGDVSEWGTKPQPGKRNDIEVVREIIKKGGRMEEVVDSVNSYQAMRCAEMILRYKEERRDWLPEVVYIHGDPGAGKSRKAREMAAERGYTPSQIYTKNSGNKWWDGYDAHPFVIVDDFRDSWFELTYMLSLIDRYEFRVENKGGSRQFLARCIVITSVIPLEELYKKAKHSEDVFRQLYRRMSAVVRIASPSPGPEVGGNTVPLPTLQELGIPDDPYWHTCLTGPE